MDTAIQVQILEEAVSISLSANTLWNGVNPTILLQGQTGLFNYSMATNLGEEKLCIKTCEIWLKIGLVSHPA